MTKRRTETHGYTYEVDDLDMLGGQDHPPPPPGGVSNIDDAERERTRRLSLPVRVNTP
jgi:hypothetical protein